MSKAEEELLGENSWVVTWSADKGWQLFVPNTGEPARVPDEALALMGAFLRLEHEKEFRAECADWFKSRSRQ